MYDSVMVGPSAFTYSSLSTLVEEESCSLVADPTNVLLANLCFNDLIHI
jgi:hypothetical protein